MSNNKGTSSGVYLTNPDNSFDPYTSSNPQPCGIGGFTDIADGSTFKRALCDTEGHLKVDIISGGGSGGDATAANQVLGNASPVTLVRWLLHPVQSML